jgi:hypothetical protein
MMVLLGMPEDMRTDFSEIYTCVVLTMGIFQNRAERVLSRSIQIGERLLPPVIPEIVKTIAVVAKAVSDRFVDAARSDLERMVKVASRVERTILETTIVLTLIPSIGYTMSSSSQWLIS